MPTQQRKPFPSSVVRSEAKDGNPDAIVTFAVSTETVDRSNEIVRAAGGRFEHYRKNPVVLWGHDHAKLNVGRGLDVRVGRDQSGRPAVLMDVEFHLITQESRDVHAMVTRGFLNAGSIGFMPIKWRTIAAKDFASEGIDAGTLYPHTPDVRTYDEWELLEYSVCNVPMNPDALRTDADAVRRAIAGGAITADSPLTRSNFARHLSERRGGGSVGSLPVTGYDSDGVPIVDLSGVLSSFGVEQDRAVSRFLSVPESASESVAVLVYRDARGEFVDDWADVARRLKAYTQGVKVGRIPYRSRDAEAAKDLTAILEQQVSRR